MMVIMRFSSILTIIYNDKPDKLYKDFWNKLIIKSKTMRKGFMSVSEFSHSVVSDSATPWTAARQASLSITNSWTPPKPMSIVSVMPSNHLILYSPLLLLPSSFPASGSFPVSKLFASGGQSIGVSASTWVPPMNTQAWSPLGGTGWISLRSKGLSRVFSNTTVQKHQFFSTKLSL